MTENTSTAVVDFLLERINPFYLEAYNTLAELEYPIHDYASLRKQLPSGDQQSPHSLVYLVLDPIDMPLETQQSALEKFHSNLLTLLEPSRFVSGVPEIPADVPMGPYEPPFRVSPNEIHRICAGAADRSVAQLVNPEPKIVIWIWLNTYFDCVKRQHPPGKVAPPGRQAFIRP